jgi:hypothetical protein
MDLFRQGTLQPDPVLATKPVVSLTTGFAAEYPRLFLRDKVTP